MERPSARLTRTSGTSFYYAFRILPGKKRRAIYALYAFCRVLDDCVDEEGGGGEAGLVRWEEEIRRCYEGRPETGIGRDLAEALGEFRIPRACFDDIVAGCRMDLHETRYPTYAALEVYCHRVASAVGLASIEIFGYRNPRTRDYAVELGLALQLTNILRDVAADAERGRLYIPLEDLARFGLTDAQLVDVARGRSERTTAADALLAFEGARARERFEAAKGLLPKEDRHAMVPAEIMGAIYRALLDGLGRKGYPLGPKVRLSGFRKAVIAASVLLKSFAA